MASNAQNRDPARDGQTESMLPEREVQFAPTVHWVHRRPLGVGPAPLLAGLAGAMVGLAIALFATGSWSVGILFLVLAGVAACLFVVAARREPDTQSARLARTAAGRADALATLLAVTVRAWSGGALELARIWHQRRRLRTKLSRRLTPLGEAVYRDDPGRADQLKREAQELDLALQEANRRASETLAAIRRQIERERTNSHATEQLVVVEQDPVSDLDGRR